ncbi:MAG: phospho-sugar mutase, partial [Bacilli bacterium]|nr:phospho-sugar mutase [Bacilli bacterium]
MQTINKWKDYKELDSKLKLELESLSQTELEDAFYKELEFGTGGMRGVIGVGTNRMNIYTLRKANYGFGKYLLGKFKNPSVAIAYDTRHKSKEFACDCARLLGKMKIKVYLFNQITPTPVLSYAVRSLCAQGGIVITASHNPHNFNGYKIYDETGCQLVPDLITQVIEEVNKAPDSFKIQVADYDELRKAGLVIEVGEEIYADYLQLTRNVSIHPELDKSNFIAVFTPLHGTSALLGERLLKELGYRYQIVDEQKEANPNFPTINYPNPEDPNAFRLALEYGKKYQADILIATDPDADRIGIAILDNEVYHLLTGNQTGALLLYYLVNEKENHAQGVVFNTIVTSNLGARIAKDAGLEVVSTLTGFKYIGEQARLLEGSKKEFFFGYEESFGYLIKPFVRDKDSLQALVLCLEVANFYKQQGKTLLQVLDEIHHKYGYHQEDLVNLQLSGIEGATQIEKIMNHFRNYSSLNFGNIQI